MKSDTSLKTLKLLLVTLITSLSITGISFLDDKIWNLVMLVIGMIAYSIVGLLFSIGLLHGRQSGKSAYVAVFIILLVLGYNVYCGIKNLQTWILSWPLYVKIIVPSLLSLMIILTVVFLIIIARNKNTDSNNKDTDGLNT